MAAGSPPWRFMPRSAVFHRKVEGLVSFVLKLLRFFTPGRAFANVGSQLFDFVIFGALPAAVEIGGRNNDALHLERFIFVDVLLVICLNLLLGWIAVFLSREWRYVSASARMRAILINSWKRGSFSAPAFSPALASASSCE